MKEMIETIKEDLKQRLSAKRFEHTESVVRTALEFGSNYKLDEIILNKIEIAAWLHDSCKELRNEELAILSRFYNIHVYDIDQDHPNLLHARVGAKWCEDEYDICDPYILKAIEEHTLGGKDMLISSKILFLADFLEPNRDKKKPVKELDELRNMIKDNEDLDKVLLKAFNSKISYMLLKNQAIHPLSIENRNHLLKAQT